MNRKLLLSFLALLALAVFFVGCSESDIVKKDGFQSLYGGMQVTHLWKSGISPILNRAGLAEKQEQVTSQLKFGVSCDQNWSK